MKVLKFASNSIKNQAPDLVFLHGFPGVRSKQNRDIAEMVCRLTSLSADVLLYQGLGHVPGIFSFEKCLDDVRLYFTDLEKAGFDKKISVVGHSWGGFLALLMANEFPRLVGKVILMSPLLEFFPLEHVSPWFKEKMIEHPDIDFGDPDKMAVGFIKIGQHYSPLELAKNLPFTIEVFFLQAKNDPVTPVNVALQVLKVFRRYPLFEIVDTDHSFLLGRSEISKKIASFLK